MISLMINYFTTKKQIEHKKFSKIPRINNINVRITEKMDGMNGVLYRTPTDEIKIGSRNKWLSKEDDCHGFYQFVQERKSAFLSLLPIEKFIYGEFIGPKINGNRYQLTEKKFYFFEPIAPYDFTSSNHIKLVPLLGAVKLDQLVFALEDFKNMFSTINKDVRAEGIILKLEGQYIKVIYDK